MTAPAIADTLRRLRGQAPTLSDADLLRRFLAGRDEAAFAALVARHGPLVLGVCRRALGDAHAAEDAFQATFLLLARRAARLRSPDALAGWLHGTARRVARQLRRGDDRRRRREQRHTPPAAPPADVTWRELRRLLDAELARLPAAYREPLILCYLEGLTQAEAARRLGCGLAVLRGRLERGRQALRKRLEKRGLPLAATLLVSAGLSGTAVSATLREAAVRAALGGQVAPVVAALAGDGAGLLAVIRAWRPITLLLAAGVVTLGLAAAGPTPSAPPPSAPPPATTAEAPRLDRYGDPLPEGAIARLGTVRFRQSFHLFSLAFSPDGRTIVAGSPGRNACLWDVTTGREILQFEQGEYARSVAFSPDGRTVALAVRGKKAILCDAATGRVTRTLDGHTSSVVGVAFSPDGRSVATGSYDKTARVWDVATGREVARMEGHEKEVQALAYSPDGKLLATASFDGTARVWDAFTGRERAVLRGATKELMAVAFAPDGKTVAASGEEPHIHLWDATTGRELRALDTASPRVHALAFAPDGKSLASGQGDGTVRLWGPATGTELRRWKASGGVLISAVTFAPDGQTLATGAGWGSTVRLWGPATGTEVRPTTGHHGFVQSLRYCDGGRSLVSVSRDREAITWHPATGRQVARLPSIPMSFHAPAVAADGRMIASAEGPEGIVTLSDTVAGREARIIGRHGGYVVAVALSEDGKFVATGGEDRTAKVWEVTTGRLRHQFREAEMVYAVAFSPDGKLLASGTYANNYRPTGETVRLRDMATGELVRTLPRGFNTWSLAYSPDGRRLAAAPGFLPDPRDTVYPITAPIQVFEVATGKELCALDQPRGAYGVAFSADGEILATGGTDDDSTVRLWEMATGQELRRFVGHHTSAGPVAFAPDGRTLASGGGDSTILLWDLTGHRAAARPARPPADAWADLAGADAARAAQSVWDLALAGPAGVEFLRSHLPAARPADPEKVARLLADLGGDAYRAREAATAELRRIGPGTEPALRRALADRPPLELKRRAEQLLAELDHGPEALRGLRAVRALEQTGTPEARAALAALAGGDPDARLTRSARAALGRIAP
jgi:RNA polymerase sigma factor (sigma-70 family)